VVAFLLAERENFAVVGYNCVGLCLYSSSLSISLACLGSPGSSVLEKGKSSSSSRVEFLGRKEDFFLRRGGVRVILERVLLNGFEGLLLLLSATVDEVVEEFVCILLFGD